MSSLREHAHRWEHIAKNVLTAALVAGPLYAIPVDAKTPEADQLYGPMADCILLNELTHDNASCHEPEIRIGHWGYSGETELGAFIIEENRRIAAHDAEMAALEEELAEVREAEKASENMLKTTWLWFTRAGRGKLDLQRKLLATNQSYELSLLNLMHERHVDFYRASDDRILDMAHKNHNGYYPVEEWARMISAAIHEGAWLKKIL